MRISTSQIFQTGVDQLGTLQGNLAKTQMQLSTNRRMLTAADDPIASARALEVTQSQSVNTQFATNRANARASLSQVEGALQSTTSLLQDVQTMVVAAGNGALSPSDRTAMATELSGRLQSMAEVLSNPVAALGVGISLPFLDWNGLSLQLKLSKAEHERAVILFRQTLLTAFGEVEDALSARAQLQRRDESLQAALDAARTVERLYGVRYRQGAVSLRIYLDAQEQTRTAEETLAANRLARLQAQATLYRALGGGLG